MKFVGRLVLYNEVTELEAWKDPATIKVGDHVQVMRGNGVREGEIVATATITKIAKGGLGNGYSIRFDGDDSDG